MNTKQQAAIRKAFHMVEEAREIVETIRDQLQEGFDGKSDKWQESEKGEAMQECISQIEDAANELEAARDALDNSFAERD